MEVEQNNAPDMSTNITKANINAVESAVVNELLNDTNKYNDVVVVNGTNGKGNENDATDLGSDEVDPEVITVGVNSDVEMIDLTANETDVVTGITESTTSKTSSNNAHNTGDDLDELLSKINNIVDGSKEVEKDKKETINDQGDKKIETEEKSILEETEVSVVESSTEDIISLSEDEEGTLEKSNSEEKPDIISISEDEPFTEDKSNTEEKPESEEKTDLVGQTNSAEKTGLNKKVIEVTEAMTEEKTLAEETIDSEKKCITAEEIEMADKNSEEKTTLETTTLENNLISEDKLEGAEKTLEEKIIFEEKTDENMMCEDEMVILEKKSEDEMKSEEKLEIMKTSEQNNTGNLDEKTISEEKMIAENTTEEKNISVEEMEIEEETASEEKMVSVEAVSEKNLAADPSEKLDLDIVAVEKKNLAKKKPDLADFEIVEKADDDLDDEAKLDSQRDGNVDAEVRTSEDNKVCAEEQSQTEVVTANRTENILEVDGDKQFAEGLPKATQKETIEIEKEAESGPDAIVINNGIENVKENSQEIGTAENEKSKREKEQLDLKEQKIDKKPDEEIDKSENEKNVGVNKNEIPTFTLDDDDDEAVVTATTSENAADTTSPTEDAEPMASSVAENAEDSDDDVVWCGEDKPADKPEKTDDEKKETDKVIDAKSKDVDTEASADENGNKKPSAEDNDDDVVLLDDDEDSVNESKVGDKNGAAEKETASESKSEISKEKEDAKLNNEGSSKATADSNYVSDVDEKPADQKVEMTFDNSDNAQDKFDILKVDSQEPEKKETEKEPEKESGDIDETVSNCSSSSNLLEETKPAVSPTADEEEHDDDEEIDLGDVEEVEIEGEDVITIADEISREREPLPPTKRIRLTEQHDDKDENSKSSSVVEMKENLPDATVEVETNEVNLVTETGGAVVRKRPHDDIESEEAGENAKVKKWKAEEELPAEEKHDGSTDLQMKCAAKEQEIALAPKEEVEDEKVEVIPVKRVGVASTLPIELYPPPVFNDNPPRVAIDFFRRYHKAFDRMTKSDLEELILQKVLESIVHKGEFAEMRKTIENQEKVIAANRLKLQELNKQFRDLEMVHTRVIRDLDQKNSQFIIPVKITRAVGLQVYIPNKKNTDPATNALANSTTYTGQSTLPQVSSNTAIRAATTTNNSTLAATLAAAVPQRSASTTEASTTTRPKQQTPLASAGAAAALNARRGCMQKITPQRPVDSTSGMSSIAGNRNQTRSPHKTAQSAQPGTPKVLNKSVVSPPTLNPQRYRYLITNSQSQMAQQQQQTYSRTPQQPQQQQLQQSFRKVVGRPPVRASEGNIQQQSQQHQQQQQQQQQQLMLQKRRSDPMPQTAIPSASTVMASLGQHSMPGVSITPAKPKEKAIIDLTDEDDGAQSAIPPPPSIVRLRQPMQQHPNANMQRSAPPLTRMPMGNQANKGPISQLPPPMQQAQRVIGSSHSIITSTSGGTSITRVNISASNAVSRIKYGHPAPLPATPPQSFNASWKLPPPRPTIRISNLDNGIVISWTMDEPLTRHADCVSYQIYAYQETNAAPSTDMWRHVGDVKAMLLPMAVTLTQFQEGQRYFFSVRAIDCHQRYGPFSLPKTWT